LFLHFDFSKRRGAFQARNKFIITTFASKKRKEDLIFVFDVFFRRSELSTIQKETQNAKL
jgi:hypothetical protein